MTSNANFHNINYIRANSPIWGHGLFLFSTQAPDRDGLLHFLWVNHQDPSWPIPPREYSRFSRNFAQAKAMCESLIDTHARGGADHWPTPMFMYVCGADQVTLDDFGPASDAVGGRNERI